MLDDLFYKNGFGDAAFFQNKRPVLDSENTSANIIVWHFPNLNYSKFLSLFLSFPVCLSLKLVLYVNFPQNGKVMLYNRAVWDVDHVQNSWGNIFGYYRVLEHVPSPESCEVLFFDVFFFPQSKWPKTNAWPETLSPISVLGPQTSSDFRCPHSAGAHSLTFFQLQRATTTYSYSIYFNIILFPCNNTIQ